MLDTTNAADPVLREADRRLGSEFSHPHYDPTHEVAVRNDRWVCMECGARPTSYESGRCECDLPQPDGSDVRCTGMLRPLYTSRAWCDGCQDFVPGHVVGLCFACEFDAEMPLTQRIPVMSMFELVFSEAALAGGGR